MFNTTLLFLVFITFAGLCATTLCARISANAMNMGEVERQAFLDVEQLEQHQNASFSLAATSKTWRSMNRPKCHGLADCFGSCVEKCRQGFSLRRGGSGVKKPYCLMRRTVRVNSAKGISSIIPCEALPGVEGIQSKQSAKKWEFLWKAAKYEAAKAEQQKAVDLLHINPSGKFRKKNHAHIHFCRVNDRGLEFKNMLRPMCSQMNSWTSLSLKPHCKEVFALSASTEQGVFSTVQRKFGLDLTDVGISVWLDVCPGEIIVMGTVRCSIEWLLCDSTWFKKPDAGAGSDRHGFFRPVEGFSISGRRANSSSSSSLRKGSDRSKQSSSSRRVVSRSSSSRGADSTSSSSRRKSTSVGSAGKSAGSSRRMGTKSTGSNRRIGTSAASTAKSASSRNILTPDEDGQKENKFTSALSASTRRLLSKASGSRRASSTSSASSSSSRRVDSSSSFRRTGTSVAPSVASSRGSRGTVLSGTRCNSLATCFPPCADTCKDAAKPYCLLRPTIRNNTKEGLDSVVPCGPPSGVDGVRSYSDAKELEFLWTSAKAEAAQATGEGSIHVLVHNAVSHRSNNHVQINFCRLNDRGLQMKLELKSLCSSMNSWESVALGSCKDGFALSGDDDMKVFTTVQRKFGRNLQDVGISLWLDVCPGDVVIMGSARCDVYDHLCESFEHDSDISNDDSAAAEENMFTSTLSASTLRMLSRMSSRGRENKVSIGSKSSSSRREAKASPDEEGQEDGQREHLFTSALSASTRRLLSKASGSRQASSTSSATSSSSRRVDSSSSSRRTAASVASSVASSRGSRGTFASSVASSRGSRGTVKSGTRCNSLETCFPSCLGKCQKGPKPYCLLRRTVKSTQARGLDSMVPCEHVSGVEGIRSEEDASEWDFLWKAANAEAAQATRQRSVDVLNINTLKYRRNDHAQIHFCRLNDKGLSIKDELKSVCSSKNSWESVESVTLGRCRDVFALSTSDDTMVFSTVQHKFGLNLEDVAISVWLNLCPGQVVVMGSKRCSINYLLCDRHWFAH